MSIREKDYNVLSTLSLSRITKHSRCSHCIFWPATENERFNKIKHIIHIFKNQADENTYCFQLEKLLTFDTTSHKSSPFNFSVYMHQIWWTQTSKSVLAWYVSVYVIFMNVNRVQCDKCVQWWVPLKRQSKTMCSGY